MTILRVSTCIFALILNLLVLTYVASSPKLRNKKNVFAINLALTDIMSSFALIADTFHNDYPNLVYEPIINAFLVASVLNILAVSLDCFIAIKWAPLKYDFIVTPPRCFIACAIIWVVSLSIYLPAAFVLHSYYFVVGYVFSPILILTLLCITAANYTAVFCSINSIDLSILGQEQTTLRKRENRGILVTFALILGSSFICWLPMCICLLLEYFVRNNSPDYFQYISDFSFELVSVNLSLNPAIFIWRLRRRRNPLNTWIR